MEVGEQISTMPLQDKLKNIMEELKLQLQWTTSCQPGIQKKEKKKKKKSG
jgi:hypothetical protein